MLLHHLILLCSFAVLNSADEHRIPHAEPHAEPQPKISSNQDGIVQNNAENDLFTEQGQENAEKRDNPEVEREGGQHLEKKSAGDRETRQSWCAFWGTSVENDEICFKKNFRKTAKKRFK